MGFRAGGLEVGMVVSSVDVISGLFHHQHNRAFAMDNEGDAHDPRFRGNDPYLRNLGCDYKRTRNWSWGLVEEEEQRCAVAGD